MADSLESNAQFTDAKFYNSHGTEYHEVYGHDTALRIVIRTFVSMLPSGAQIIECGPGTGIVAKTIADSGGRLHGIDMSEGMVAICQERVPEGTFEVANMLEYDVPASSYDGVVASLSIFELTKQEIIGMLQKWNRWTKEGGFLFIGTCDPEEWGVPPERYDSDGCIVGAEAKFLDHIVSNTLLTRAGWKKQLEKAGFEVVHAEFDRFQPASDNEMEPRYYIIARKTAPKDQ